MKVVLDITRLLRRSSQSTPTGIDRVELAYARHLLGSRHYQDDAAFVARLRASTWYLDAETVAGFVDALASRWKQSEGKITRRELVAVESFLDLTPGVLTTLDAAPARSSLPDMMPPLKRLLSPVNLLPRLLRRRSSKGAVYLNVSHEGLNSINGVRSMVRGHGLKPIYLVHDLIPLTHPEYVRPGDAEKHETRMRTVLGSAEAIIANSHHTLDQLKSFAERNDMSVPASIVSPLGIEDEFGMDAPVEAPAHPFFLTVGTIEPRKNHLVLLHAWRALVEKLGPKAPKLIIVGRRGWENENVIDIIERCEKLGNHVLECNRLPDVHLRRLMKQSQAVLFPSFAEGYGLPLFEAMALRVPVICSDLQAFRDIAGTAPRYLDPIDGLGWARAIEEYARPDSSSRAEQLQALQHIRMPRWSDHFSIVDRLIEAVAAPAPAPLPAPSWRPATSAERTRALISAGERLEGARPSFGFAAAQPHSSTR
ncbi:glycosyltransferase involved in cell wall biosynthesis [Angulomicrobium tetraedrale]|uniref:Glycosyltransferase involved in cell wall biosynthesis n=1 Tax=Ancylobacter tetraedralis TaxID=217068 RepID=A0A839ZGG6_9HYPH|nr:glycosyltransferase family 1 protein [Ancylobacter tetraedralis]MBB3773687.1 glycosyltransferase involved in cell wall biosynthesis [Ancylobacter tetraedralis]